MKKIFVLLVVAISLFSFNVNAEAKAVASYDLTRNTAHEYVPSQKDIFNFVVVNPNSIVIHHGNLLQYIEADCLANNEFIVVSKCDIPRIKKSIGRYFFLKAHGIYTFKGHSSVQSFVARHGITEALKVSFVRK